MFLIDLTFNLRLPHLEKLINSHLFIDQHTIINLIKFEPCYLQLELTKAFCKIIK